MNPTQAVPRSAVDAAARARQFERDMRAPALFQWFAVFAVALAVLAAANDYRRAHADELDPKGGVTCPGPVIDYTFHAYDGPTRIVSCGRFTYNAGRLTVDAYDPEVDGLFRNGFDAPPEG